MEIVYRGNRCPGDIVLAVLDRGNLGQGKMKDVTGIISLLKGQWYSPPVPLSLY